MDIVLDKEVNEYGVLREMNAADHFVQTNNNLVKAQNEMTPDHLFYDPNIKKIKLKDVPKELKKINLPVIEFFDKNKKAYDSVIFTEVNEKRFELIKPISNLNEFFCFKRNKENN